MRPDAGRRISALHGSIVCDGKCYLKNG
ncbi:MAG: hypothetical protein QOJ99_4972, partial [Bryobacterales bacterium]|nr:hypothetical protein [Bryobacterales bacterium]